MVRLALDDGGEPLDFGEEFAAAFGERVGEGEGGAEDEGREGERLRADGGAGVGEHGVDADGAQQGGLSGHVGAADEVEVVGLVAGLAETDVVGDGAGEQRVAELRGGEVRGVGGWQEFGPGVLRVLVGVGGDGVEGFELGPGGEPGAHGGGVVVFPAGDGDGGLGAGGEEEREDEEVLLGALLDDGEAGFELLEELDGAGGLKGFALEGGEQRGCEGGGLQEGEAFGDEADVLLQAGAGVEERHDFAVEDEADGALDGEDEGEQRQDEAPGAKVGEAGEEQREVEGGGDEEGEAVGEGKVGRDLVEPFVEEAGGDLVEAGGAEQGDLLAEVGVGEELLDGGLAGEGLLVGDGLEEIAGEAALAGAGADGGEEAEEGVVAEEVEVAVVEVAGRRRTWPASVPVRPDLGLGAVGAAQGAVVEGDEALLAGQPGLQAEREPDEADRAGKAADHEPGVAAGDGDGGEAQDDEQGEEAFEGVAAALCEGVVELLMRLLELGVAFEDVAGVPGGGAAGVMR